QGQPLPSSDPLPQAGIDHRGHHFVVRALMNVPTSSQVAIFNIIQVGEDAAEANALMDERLQGLIADLGQLGFAPADLFVDMITQVPIFEYVVEKKRFSKTYNEVPAGIELQKNLHIRFRDGNLLDDIVKLAALHEIYDLVKVDYFFDGQEAVLDTLRGLAMRQIEKRVDVRQQLGVRYDSTRRTAAESHTLIYPLDRYRSYQGFGSSALENLRQRDGVTQIRKPQTLYYDQVRYEDYDIVLNPEMLEPCVQVSYVLEAYYYLEEKVAPEVKTEVVREVEYRLLTPEGKLQTLHLQRYPPE
ncbi:MAG: SIMPL domain-containing protein, partial [Bacteroidetes bacterium]